MIYLDSFKLPTEKDEYSLQQQAVDNWQFGGHSESCYPCRIFLDKYLEQVDFSDVTILYGGNGSGKSTLLNLIAQKLKLKRLAPFNGGLIFDAFVERCRYKTGYDDEGNLFRIPGGSRLVTSDDVFDFMFNVRTNNKEISQNIDQAGRQHYNLTRSPTVRLNSMADYEQLHQQMEARSMTARKYKHKTVGVETVQHSNGETALKFFGEMLQPGRLYLLDEPENSMSPAYQQQLVKDLEQVAKYCNVQLVIATHSPFVLAMHNAKIYNLDTVPVSVCNWWELDNVKTFFDFFYSNKSLFLKDGSK